MSDLFALRNPQEGELDAINALLESEGFDVFDSLEGVTVAANTEDELVGFIRMYNGEDNCAYVYPVVVFDSWRQHGVGKALMEFAMDTYDVVKLVSRGWVNDFYRKLGFTEMEWDEVDAVVAGDCYECPLYEECHPQPFIFKS